MCKCRSSCPSTHTCPRSSSAPPPSTAPSAASAPSCSWCTLWNTTTGPLTRWSAVELPPKVLVRSETHQCRNDLCYVYTLLSLQPGPIWVWKWPFFHILQFVFILKSFHLLPCTSLFIHLKDKCHLKYFKPHKPVKQRQKWLSCPPSQSCKWRNQYTYKC